jgi:hypothetical protein
MSQGTYLLTLNLDSKKAVKRMMDRLAADGMKVIRSFDLQTARAAHVDCTCPHHGKDECDCQLVVLLVYDDQGTPITLVAHGKDNKTHFALVDPPESLQERLLKTKILQAMALEGFATIRREFV